jgi:7-keto-8-aminopelargonate synthetase-like enzyme
MSYLASSSHSGFPAPCIVDCGIVINKQDIQRLLTDLGHVHYRYTQEDAVLSEGEGFILEVFADAQQATVVTNSSLYLNVCSFDYLELRRSPDGDAYFDLVQDNCTLSLMPLSNPVKHQGEQTMNVAAIEAMIAEVLSANIDMRLDSGENLSF